MSTGTTGALDRLFLLQEVLIEVHQKIEKRAKTPEHLAHVEAAYREARAQREENEKTLARAGERRKALEGEILDLNEKLKKYQTQLQSVKTNREYGALLNELDVVKRDVRTREDEILALEETSAAAAAELERRNEAFPAEEAGYEEQMKEWRAEQALLTDEIAKAEAQAKALREELDHRLLSTFDRLSRVRAGIAVAKVDMVGTQTAACSACHVRLRPQLLSDLRLGRETVTCESCKRILYWAGA
ncbi:MAG TPA: C4-type zinc ribbon domain-containing protein [Thermoanaerobaculia bacterium]|nr:C4-type zinc ribbon domain-containing protein [Thermoanaerobaculia bacterium]